MRFTGFLTFELFRSKKVTFSPFKRLAVLSKAIPGKQFLSSKTIGSPLLEAIIIFSLSGITPTKVIPKISNLNLI